MKTKILADFEICISVPLKEVRLNSCRTDVLYYCNRLLVGSNLNYFRERYAPFVFHLRFFLKCKTGLKRSKAEFIQKSYLVLL